MPVGVDRRAITLSAGHACVDVAQGAVPPLPAQGAVPPLPGAAVAKGAQA
jgi:hypothetical protein